MKRLFIYLLLLPLFFCCKNEDKKSENPTTEIKEKEKRDYNSIAILKNKLEKQDINEASYNNIEFDKYGANFSNNGNSLSYIEIPMSNVGIDLKKGFNISFRFKISDYDGTKPQSLFVLADKFSSPSRVPFYIYFPAKKISGVYGQQLLWADGYNAKNGYSKEYYDSFPLEEEQMYFVSVNFNGEKIDIYVESELYMSYSNIAVHDLKAEKILLGGIYNKNNNTLSNPFTGAISNLQIYSEPLEESEIVSIYNDLPYIE